jgi:three-Cys-motif partner protein
MPRSKRRRQDQRTGHGGPWTDVKLDTVAAYLQAYATALSRQRFVRTYIDAFAGTGFRTIPSAKHTLLEPGSAATVAAGSARRALDVTPPFDRYIFIEKNKKHYEQLRQLALEKPELACRMDFRSGDANEELREVCQSTDWRRTRALVFLDPFGMQVDWATLEALAGTKAVDVWYLVPVAIGALRVMPLDRLPPLTWQARLDRMFGELGWREFYTEVPQQDMWDAPTVMRRHADRQAVESYVLRRLRTIFPGVASRGRVIRNRRNAMYLLVFACANPRGKTLALRIAESILRE